MPNHLVVQFPGLLVHVDWESFHRWFPGMNMNNPRFDGENLTSILHTHLRPRYNIGKTTVRRILQEVFGFLKPSFNHMFGETRTQVTEALTRLLEQSSHSFGADLQRVRHTFTVLAYFANMYNSELLAGALLDFWYAHSHIIVQKEQAEHWSEWQRSQEKVARLGSEGMLHAPAHMGMLTPSTMPFGGWPRGRATHQHALAWPDHRALSAPARRHRSIPDLRIALPRSGWTTPVHSPMNMGYPRADYFDEMGDLYWQQEEMNAKLDNIGMKVDQMLVRSL